jgi:hypothetical protein
MRRRKRFIIKLVTLGLAVAAISASPVQARLDEGTGVPKQTEPTLATGSDNRGVNLKLPAPYEPTVGQGSPTSTSSDNDNDVAMVTLGVAGIILALGACVAMVAVYEARKRRLASI